MTAIVLALSLLQAAKDAKPEPALAPLVEVSKRLHAGAVEFLKGTAAAEAFKPWPATGRDGLLAAMKAAGVARLDLLQMELSVVFLKGGRPVGAVGTSVWSDDKEAGLLGIAYGVPPADAPVPEPTPADLVDHNAPFGKAARGLIEALKAKNTKAIAVADPDAVANRTGDEHLVRVLRAGILQTRLGLTDVCTKVAELDYDEARVVIDDVHLLGHGADGELRGVVEAKFSCRRGEVSFELRRFRPSTR